MPDAAPSHPRPRLGAEEVTPVSERLIGVRLIAQIPMHVVALAAVAAAVAAWILWDAWWPAPIAAVLVIQRAIAAMLTPRRVRAIGYREGAEELLVARGIMFRSITVVPFGRVQSVEVGEGPLERSRGVAHLSITTAATGGGTTLPGLPKDEAERLRVLLTERGVALMAAL